MIRIIWRPAKHYFICSLKALLLKPANASTHSAIGVLHAITGKTELAVESFHKALSLQRDDAFSNTMLRRVIDTMVEESKDGRFLCIFCISGKVLSFGDKKCNQHSRDRKGRGSF